jgi:TolB protein
MSTNICAMDPATSDIRQITKGGDPKASPRWSPDRRNIAFHQRTGEKTDVFTMNVDGTGVRKVTDSDGITLYRNPSWSPDGRQLAIECGKPPVWDICVAGLNATTGARRLTHGTEAAHSSEGPDWSPDGKRLAFQSNRDAMPAAGPRGGTIRGYDVYTMTIDGGDVRRLSTTPMGRSTLSPAWSPDGSRLIVASTRDGDIVQWDPYVLSPDGSSMQAVTHDRIPYGYGHPRWSPDGHFFVFHSNRDGAQQTAAEVELYVIRIDGTGIRRLTNNHDYDGFADW